MSSSYANAEHLKGVHSRVDEGLPSYMIGAGLCAVIGCAFWVGSAECHHWFIIPVVLCGMLISIDAVEWARGKVDVMDPVGLLGLFGLHFFFFSPLLQVSNDFWVSDWLSIILPPPDWRPWVGAMATLNLGGLVIYRYVITWMARASERRPAARKLAIDHNAFPVLMAIAVAIAGVLQLWVYYRFGGIIGYITAVEEYQSEAFEGWGRICLISESLPLLLVLTFAVYGRDNPLAKSWIALSGLAVAFLILTLLSSGLRGSRSNTIWALFWAVGLVHFWIRPISKKVVCGGLVFLMLFMYGYGFYKWGGRDGVASLLDARARSSWVEETNRSALRTLTFDMGRCDVQGCLLYYITNSDDYQYGWGRTYAGTAALLIPQSLWPDRPPTKRKEGTEALFGRGSFEPGEFEMAWIYGLAGEAMLNFGPLAVPFSFIVLGLVVGFTRRLASTLEPGDVRLLFLPFLVSMCIITLAWDSNNLLVFAARNLALPGCIVLLATKLHDNNRPQPKDEPSEHLTSPADR